MRRCRGASRADVIVTACCIMLALLTLGAAGESARQLAQELLCLSNNETLTEAWLAYAEDNDGQLVGGHTGTISGQMQWVDNPSSLEAPLNEKLDAIRRGALFTYVDDLNVYHCPADQGLNYPDHPVFRTYSIAGGANGESWTEYEKARVYADLEHPASQYIFVEEAAPRGRCNTGSWQMSPASQTWVDPLAMWHTESTVLGFADGHAEVHRWHDRSLIEWCQRAMYEPATFSFSMTPPNDEQTDITYMAEHFPYKSLQ